MRAERSANPLIYIQLTSPPPGGFAALFEFGTDAPAPRTRTGRRERPFSASSTGLGGRCRPVTFHYFTRVPIRQSESCLLYQILTHPQTGAVWGLERQL